jgi:hypothetical protein
MGATENNIPLAAASFAAVFMSWGLARDGGGVQLEQAGKTVKMFPSLLAVQSKAPAAGPTTLNACRQTSRRPLASLVVLPYPDKLAMTPRRRRELGAKFYFG